MIYGRTRTRCRRVLEHLFRVHSSEVLESIVVCWNESLSVRFYHIYAIPLTNIRSMSEIELRRWRRCVRPGGRSNI